MELSNIKFHENAFCRDWDVKRVKAGRQIGGEKHFSWRSEGTRIFLSSWTTMT